MAKVTGIGGVFFKTDSDATAKWFTEVLGMPTEPWGCAFPWRERDDPERRGYTVLGLHSRDSDYFGPSDKPFMINFRVDDLTGMLARLRERGVKVVKEFEPQPNGRFAHVEGPDGIVLELWQPITAPAVDPYDP